VGGRKLYTLAAFFRAEIFLNASFLILEF